MRAKMRLFLLHQLNKNMIDDTFLSKYRLCTLALHHKLKTALLWHAIHPLTLCRPNYCTRLVTLLMYKDDHQLNACWLQQLGHASLLVIAFTRTRTRAEVQAHIYQYLTLSFYVEILIFVYELASFVNWIYLSCSDICQLICLWTEYKPSWQ